MTLLIWSTIIFIIIGIIIFTIVGRWCYIGYGIIAGFLGSMIFNLIVFLIMSCAATGANTTTTLVEIIPLAQIETEDPTQVCYLAVNEKYLSKSSKRYYYFAERDNINSLDCDYFRNNDIKYLTDDTQPYIEVYEEEYTNKVLKWYFGEDGKTKNKIAYIPKDSVVKAGIPEYLKLVD